MRFEDDTPEPGQLPPVYPRNPPINLLRGANALAPPNLFAFEGLDGSGKSTLARAAADRCTSDGRRGVVFRLGRSDIVAHALERAKWLNADPVTLNLLNWITVFQNTILCRDQLGDPRVLLFADRYSLSIKVRGVLEGLGTDFMDILEAKVPRPRRIFLIDAPPELCLERIRAAKRAISYFEAGFRDVPGIGDPMVERLPPDPTAGREAQLLRHLTRSREVFFRLAERVGDVMVIENIGDPERALMTITRELEPLTPAP